MYFLSLCECNNSIFNMVIQVSAYVRCVYVVDEHDAAIECTPHISEKTSA